MGDNTNMNAHPTSAVSLELLDEYTGGDQDFLQELVDQFWLDLEDRLPQLHQASSPFNGPVFKGLAHSLAGSATCVGAEGLREKALALEACGRDGQAQAAPELLAEFEQEVARVRAFFADYLS